MLENREEAACILAELKKPFPEKLVRWRIGHRSGDRAMVLAYITARDVMKRLDDVVGIDGWKREHHFANGMMLCKLSIKFGDEWVVKEDGAGETQVEAEKGGLSDSFKRAGVNFGIFRYGYYLPTSWVKVDEKGKFTSPSLPDWAKP